MNTQKILFDPDFDETRWEKFRDWLWDKTPDSIARLYHTINDFRIDIGWFFYNIWLHRTSLWNARTYNGENGLMYLRIHLQDTLDVLERYGHEVWETRKKKIEMIKDAIDILQRLEDDNYHELCGYALPDNYKLSTRRLSEDEIQELNDSSTGEKWSILYEMTDNLTKEQDEINSKAFKEGDKWREEDIKKLSDILFGDYYIEETKTDTGKNIFSWWH